MSEQASLFGPTLGDVLPREMARVRNEVMPVYRELGPAGAFAAVSMQRDLEAAERATAAADAGAMLAAWMRLREYQL